LIFPGSDLVKAPQEPEFEALSRRGDLLIFRILQAFAFDKIIVGAEFCFAGTVVYGNEAGAGSCKSLPSYAAGRYEDPKDYKDYKCLGS